MWIYNIWYRAACITGHCFADSPSHVCTLTALNWTINNARQKFILNHLFSTINTTLARFVRMLSKSYISPECRIIILFKNSVFSTSIIIYFMIILFITWASYFADIEEIFFINSIFYLLRSEYFCSRFKYRNAITDKWYTLI